MSESLANIGRLALAEHEAWKSRNAARTAFRDWCATYHLETDEYFDPSSDVHHEPGELAAYRELLTASKKAQSKLQVARAATRRAIVRAIADAGKVKPNNGEES